MHEPSRHEPKLMVGLVWGVIMGLALYAALAPAPHSRPGLGSADHDPHLVARNPP